MGYEVVVKAGNSNGTSQLTKPLNFITADQFIIASPAQGTDVGGAVGVAFAVIIVIAMVVVIVYFLKEKRDRSLRQETRESDRLLREPFLHCQGPGQCDPG